jgi:hypothetical protein
MALKFTNNCLEPMIRLDLLVSILRQIPDLSHFAPKTMRIGAFV